MSVKDCKKVINIQDLTTGDIAYSIPTSLDALVSITLPFYQYEMVAAICVIIKDEHDACIKIGYKG